MHLGLIRRDAVCECLSKRAGHENSSRPVAMHKQEAGRVSGRESRAVDVTGALEL